MKRVVALCLVVLGVGSCLLVRSMMPSARTVNSALKLAAAWLERGQRAPRVTLKNPSRRSLARGGGQVAVVRRAATVVQEQRLPVGSPVLAMAETADGLWLGTFDEGLFRDGVQVDGVDLRINDLAAGEGGLFAATNGGAYEVRAEGARRLGKGAFTAAAVWKGEAYFTSRQGLSVLTPTGLWTRGPAQGVLADNPASLEACGAHLCIGALDGLWLFDGESARHRSSADDALPSDWVTAIAHGPGVTWVGTFDGGLARVEPERARRFAPEDGLPEGRVQPHGLAVVDGCALAATPSGLLRVCGDSVALIQEGLPVSELTAVIPAARGGVWVGYRGGASRVVWAVDGS